MHPFDWDSTLPSMTLEQHKMNFPICILTTALQGSSMVHHLLNIQVLCLLKALRPVEGDGRDCQSHCQFAWTTLTHIAHWSESGFMQVAPFWQHCFSLAPFLQAWALATERLRVQPSTRFLCRAAMATPGLCVAGFLHVCVFVCVYYSVTMYFPPWNLEFSRNNEITKKSSRGRFQQSQNGTRTCSISLGDVRDSTWGFSPQKCTSFRPHREFLLPPPPPASISKNIGQKQVSYKAVLTGKIHGGGQWL